MDDDEVQKILTNLGEPALLEGETFENRIERLRDILNNEASSRSQTSEIISQPALLLQCRHSITAHSLIEAKKRIEAERKENLEKYQQINPEKERFSAIGSMFCDSRLPMSVSIDTNNDTIAIAGWSGECSLWNMQGKLKNKLIGHNDKVQCVNIFQGKVATGSFDNNVRVWGEVNETYSGHYGRVNTVKWHPHCNYILSASHDMTWKVWDSEKHVSILTQEGHNRGIYALSIHPDGSLVATGDLSGIGALWDIRTGNHILTLKGHLKDILACTIAPNGYNIASGSADNTIKIWDIRRKGLLYNIPAHSKLISSVDIYGNYIASSSYDGFVKIWRLSDFSLIQSIDHTEKVTDVCFDSIGNSLVSTCFDRTFKIWKK